MGKRYTSSLVKHKVFSNGLWRRQQIDHHKIYTIQVRLLLRVGSSGYKRDDCGSKSSATRLNVRFALETSRLSSIGQLRHRVAVRELSWIIATLEVLYQHMLNGWGMSFRASHAS